MAIEMTYDTKEAIPEGMDSLFTEKEGKFHLTEVTGMKTQQDVNNVQEALRKERLDHTAAKDLLKPWAGMDHAKVTLDLATIPELKIASEGKMDDDKINTIVESRIAKSTGPLDVQIKTLTEERDQFAIENTELKSAVIRRDLNDEVRVVATEMKVQPTAIVDVEMVAAAYFEKDDVSGLFVVKAGVQGATPGTDIKTFLKEMQKLRPHWWPASEGGGAGGGAGGLTGDSNPWSEKGWNLTTQGAVIRDKGMAAAQTLAAAAGSKVGATAATKK